MGVEINEKVKSWADFTKEVDKFAPYFIYFRGQSKWEWELEPSIQRHFKRTNLVDDVKAALDLEGSALREFKAQAHNHISPNTLTVTGEGLANWWGLMQHHGAPTRLLDWTKSIYVAAYFAVIDDLGSDGAIWLVRHESFQQKMKEKFGADCFLKWFKEEELLLNPDAPNAVIFFEKEQKIPRMAIQQSLASMCLAILGNQTNIISEVMKGVGMENAFVKIKIPAKLKPEFIIKLHSMNISANSLFPGIDGLARSINELFLMRI